MKNIAKYWISEETLRVDDNFNLKPNEPVVKNKWLLALEGDYLS